MEKVIFHYAIQSEMNEGRKKNHREKNRSLEPKSILFLQCTVEKWAQQPHSNYTREEEYEYPRHLRGG